MIYDYAFVKKPKLFYKIIDKTYNLSFLYDRDPYNIKKEVMIYGFININ